MLEMSCNANKLINCVCTNLLCPRHGKCCECIANHRPNSLPACFVSKGEENNHNKNLEHLIKN